MRAIATELLSDEGTVCVFAGTLDGQPITFGVDHRPARWLADRLCEIERVHVEIEPWQVLR